MQQKPAQVYSEILKKITPTQKDKAKIETLTRELEQKITAACAKHGVKATVRAEGSVAKDTWLSENRDIDIFMRLPATIPRKALGEISLKIAREATAGSKQIERFAEHPYLEAFVEGVRVNVVPCYDVKRGEWLSATDRTPFHTDYVQKRLDKTLRNEVRLLKKFMQGIGVYGAEIKIGGFSGYLCELLIMHYKSITATLQAFAQYTRLMVIDIENYYAGREKEVQLLFAEPLVVIDPVDKARNVASAVQPQKLYTFVGAARAFLKTPDQAFFYPPPTKTLSTGAMKQKLKSCGSAYVFVTCAAVEAVPDVLWGQLYRTQRALRKIAALSDFKVLRDAAWSDEKTLNVFILELEQRVLPSVKKHLGPPLTRENECRKFLAKYAEGNSDVVAGPYIEDGRWVVELQRRCTDAAEMFKEKLRGGGRNTGVAELVSQALKREFSVLVNGEISAVYSKNEAFAEFLTDFLKGKPFWLEAAGAHFKRSHRKR
jgi:tRNA nucleotidyltransferase (CCA-adding enzyme)